MVAGSGELRRVFAKDGDGKISAAELRLCMKAATGEDMSAEDARALVASADVDEVEFLRLAGEVPGDDEKEEKRRWLREAFAMYEMEGSGRITALSLKLVLARLGAHRDIGECQAIICRFDLDGDGVLSFDEFRTMMMG